MYHSLIEIRLSNIHWISYYVIFMLFRSILMSCFVMLGYSIKSIIWKLINGKFFVLTLMSLVLFFNVVLLFFISRYEYISLSFGYSYIALLQALTGFIGIIGISSLLTKIKYIGDIFKVIGINSLFIMVTHVYLETPTWSVGLKISSNLFISECIIVFLIVLLEFFLCRFIKPYFDLIIKNITLKV